MASRYNKCLLLGTFCVCVAMATVDPNTHSKKSYGSRTCPQLCIRITECSCYLYLSYGITCPPRIAADNQQNPEMNRRKVHVEKVLNCSQVRGTKRRIKQCRPSLERLLPYKMKEERREGEFTKLLILLYGTSHQGQQLFLHNNTVVPYPSIRVNLALAVAYISSLRKLVVSTVFKKQLFFTPINKLKKDIVKNRTVVRGLAVDDKEHLVFMTTLYPRRSVSVVTTEGKNWTSLVSVSLKRFPMGIAADHTRFLLYVASERANILMFTYQGVSRGAIPGQWLARYVLSMDIENDHLYFKHKTSNTMFQMSLSDHSVKNLTTFETVLVVSRVVAIHNTMYVSMSRKNYILAINVSDPNNITSISLPFSTAHAAVVMCAIP